jgi:hypothetical protein
LGGTVIGWRKLFGKAELIFSKTGPFSRTEPRSKGLPPEILFGIKNEN